MSFIGHYVVICGYDTDADEFEIRDPASSRYHLYLSLYPIILISVEKEYFLCKNKTAVMITILMGAFGLMLLSIYLLGA
jgi:hypothetical protein